MQFPIWRDVSPPTGGGGRVDFLAWSRYIRPARASVFLHFTNMSSPLRRLRGDYILENCRSWVAWCREKNQGGARLGGGSSKKHQKGWAEGMSVGKLCICIQHIVLVHAARPRGGTAGDAWPLSSNSRKTRNGQKQATRDVHRPFLQATRVRWSSSCRRWRRSCASCGSSPPLPEIASCFNCGSGSPPPEAAAPWLLWRQ